MFDCDCNLIFVFHPLRANRKLSLIKVNYSEPLSRFSVAVSYRCRRENQFTGLWAARISIKTAPLKFHFLVDGRFSSVFLVSRLHNRVKKFAKLSLPSAEMNFSTSIATLVDSRRSSSFTTAQGFRLACRIVGHRPKEKRKFIELRGSASFYAINTWESARKLTEFPHENALFTTMTRSNWQSHQDESANGEYFMLLYGNFMF